MREKQIWKNIGLESFAERLPRVLLALEQAGLDAVTRLTLHSGDPVFLLKIASFVIPDRPDFLLQGKLVVSEQIREYFCRVESGAGAILEHSWGAWDLTLSRNQKRLRSLTLRHFGHPEDCRLEFEKLEALFLGCGATRVSETVVRMEGDVLLELLTGPVKRLQLVETVSGLTILDQAVWCILDSVKCASRTLVTLKSSLEDFRMWVESGFVVPVPDFRGLVGVAPDLSDVRSNVELSALSGLTSMIGGDLMASRGVLEMVAVRPLIGRSEVVGTLQFGWQEEKSRISWIPISSDKNDLREAWEAIARVD